jgi:hypothetical protein
MLKLVTPERLAALIVLGAVIALSLSVSMPAILNAPVVEFSPLMSAVRESAVPPESVTESAAVRFPAKT